MTYNSKILIDTYSIETHTEIVHLAGLPSANNVKGFLTSNSGTNAVYTAVNTHSYLDAIFFDEGDYEIDLTYFWRHSTGGGGITSYYASASAPDLTLNKDTTNEFDDAGNNPTPVANGTFTQIGSHLYHSQTLDSTYVLKIELGMQFRVTGNPIVPNFTNYNWGSYASYSRGVHYKMHVKKYKLNTL
tara:strand:+ start:2732 stop:3292 length:561 start_codon:yes stop_codon:yes gene_type:complete